MMRIVQAGTGTARNLVIAYLVGPHLDTEVRRALGPEPCIVAYTEGKSAENLDQLIASVTQKAHFASVKHVVLVGYSLGCSGVRARLLEESAARASIAALVLVDGTHASMPAEPWQIEVWREQFDRARRGDILAVATHTLQTYVEHLTAPATPFLATVTVLRRATDWPLAEAGPIDAPASHNDGKLWVYSYQSKSIDAPAHIQLQRRALPEMLARHVRPHLDALDGALESFNAPRALAPSEGEVQFGAQALEAAERSRALAAPTRPPLEHVLRLGSRGDDVAAWQRIIGVDADGIFGPETQSVTKRWQALHHLAADGIVGPLSWAAAAAVGTPVTGLVTKTATPLSETELAAALEIGHHVALGESAAQRRIACAWAQIALENDRGRALWNNNMGNITAFGSWKGAYYVIQVAERVRRNPDVWKQIDMRFRAHADAIAGAADYWKLMSGRYGSSLAYFDAGDAEGAALELSRLGYFTANADPYARAMGSLYREFIQRNLGD
ncbi:MAG: peptidoglycan-binding protein [Minicystis sp.]